MAENDNVPTLDYARFEGRDGRRQRVRLAGKVSLVVVAAILLLLPILVVADWYSHRADLAYFPSVANSAVILGKSPAQIETTLGTADSVPLPASGTGELVFIHGRAGLDITFRNGIAVSSHLFTND